MAFLLRFAIHSIDDLHIDPIPPETGYIDTTLAMSDEDIERVDRLAAWLSTTRMGAIKFIAREIVKEEGEFFHALEDDARKS